MKKSVALGVAGLAVAAVVGGVMATTTSFAATSTPPPATVAQATAGPAAAGPVDLASPALRAAQKGAVVTLSKGKVAVATMTLTDARYTRTSAHALVTITSQQKVKINTGQFKVYVGDGDYGLDHERVLTLPAGTHSVTLDANSPALDPHGFGWDGTGDNVNAQWLRS